VLALREQQQRKRNLTKYIPAYTGTPNASHFCQLVLTVQVKISRALALREQQQRKRNLTKYNSVAASTSNESHLLPTGFLTVQVKISKALALREQQQRKRNLTKYIPDAAGAICAVLAAMAGSSPRGPKRRRLQEASSLLHQVARKEVRGIPVFDLNPNKFLTGVFDCCSLVWCWAWQPAAPGGSQGGACCLLPVDWW
jgi:hypothetical protein